MKTTNSCLFFAILLIAFVAVIDSLAISFVQWEWQWFWETNAGLRMFVLLLFIGGGGRAAS